MIFRFVSGLFLTFLFVMLIWLLSYVDNRSLFLTSNPTSHDTGPLGLSQLRQRISKEGIQTASIDSRYQALHGGKETDNNLLILTLPAAIPARQEELESLAAWVAAGNHLLIMLALDDQPHWLNKQNKFSIDHFLSVLNLQLIQLGDGATVEDKPTKPSLMFSQLTHPVTRHIQEIQGSVVTQMHVWQLRGLAIPQSTLIMLREKQTLSPVAWLSLFGKGKVYVFTHSDLFANANIDKADNRMLLKNLLDYSLGDSANKSPVIYFDDIHHAGSFIPRSVHPLLHPFFILLFGMLCYRLVIYVIQRMRQQKTRNRDTLEQWICKLGITRARTDSSNEAALSYARYFFNSVRARLALPENSQPAWDSLKKQNVNSRLLHKAEQLYQQALLTKRINLDKFVDHLEKLRKQIK